MDKHLVIALVIFCAMLGAMGQVFFKLASKDVSLHMTDWLFNYKFIVGASLYAISAVLFVWSLKFGNLSTLYPIIATSYIWVSILSITLLGEHFPPFKWIGVALILTGIVVISN